MRKLATVRQISDLRPIPNADLIELAIIDGWQAVVKKGEYNIGDKVVYCEIDSFLPVKPEYEFLRSSCYRKLADGTEGFRIRTMKLKGELSQGLVLPLADTTWQLDQDVTELLNITLYSPLAGKLSIGGDIKGLFPSFIPKTDEERIQNLTRKLQEFQTRTWTITEKLDGTSFTAYNFNGEFGVCSRNYELYETDSNVYWQAVKTLKLRDLLYGFNIAIQGELLAPGIQGNKYGVQQPTLYVFNVYSITKQQYFIQEKAQEFCKLLGLNFVPVLASNVTLPSSLEDILISADGISRLNKVQREGVVFVSDENPRISFKAISNRYLLKERD